MRKTGTRREAPPDRECDEAVPGCILVQVTPGHRFEFALQGLLGTTYVLTAVTDTFKHLQADDDVSQWRHRHTEWYTKRSQNAK